MRVAVWHNNRDIRVEQQPVPEIGPGELIMRVEASGICGTDVMEWYRIDRAPLILGHEVAGVVNGVGDGVTDYQIGDRIVAAHHVSCGVCHYCHSGHETVCETLRRTNFDPGGFAEFIRLPAINVERGVFPLPDSVTFDSGTFVEPLACVLRGQRQAGLSPGQSVLVLGSGISGILHIRLAVALGAGRVIATDISDYRLEAALHSGAETVFKAGDIDPGKLRQVNDGRLADIVIICAGAPAATEQAISMVERGGTILFFAATTPDAVISAPVNDIFWRSEVTLTSSYAGSGADYAAALELIRAGRVEVEDLVTHRLPLEEIVEGFRLVSEAGRSIKVIIQPQK